MTQTGSGSTAATVPATSGGTLAPVPDDVAVLHETVIGWYRRHARVLPWRSADRTAWAVMVSEFMLQQTPVVRVLPVWEQWLRRWPTPADLAAEPSGEAVRAWGRLGYPRRALRLHAAAVAVTERHGGHVPDDEDALLALPGVGAYTAAAIAAFAHGRRTVVLDTNIRRVFTRVLHGTALPRPSLTVAETRLARELLPTDDAEAATWNVAVMELGALVCTARSPRCTECPLANRCAWLAAGRPDPEHQPTGQAWAGTTRQLRGAILAVVREATGPVDVGALVRTATGTAVLLDVTDTDSGTRGPLRTLAALGHDEARVRAALDGLAADGLVKLDGDGPTVRLPD
ncbi:A/G-specific adenine glycosylase [Tersicoccus sp. Bi-70]|uniref:A/G-specific adenine glycosylase n=1 Tax=Tersicoccus sp. Bi-70 TaxID=1897634 RepID=UPI0009FA0034|nr:A/G-specific adenine glycosylase [Tersicoccus sp. Bi-70]